MAGDGLEVGVLVLGDVGRSPRMQYHALSLARHTGRVTLIGLRGSPCFAQLNEEVAQGRIKMLLLTDGLLPRPRSRVLYLAYAPLKALLSLAQLLHALFRQAPRFDVLLIQSPPAIPTLAAAWIVRLLTGCSVVVDWHNLAFSVLSHGGLGHRHPFVVASYLYEWLLGRCLDEHLCVTRAMSQWLKERWGVEAQTLHDRPPEAFKRATVEAKHHLFLKLRPSLVDAKGDPLWLEDISSVNARDAAQVWCEGGTPWTTVDALGNVRARPGAPKILVSSTSWSADEDFTILLSALECLEVIFRRADEASSPMQQYYGPSALRRRDSRAVQFRSPQRETAPKIVAFITGRGPLRQFYEKQIRDLALCHVAIITTWLEPDDYPILLGCADLGVCLHASTSGLDLPMKVLDMFGSGLPVCALNFPTLSELVTHGRNGLIFSDASQLEHQLMSLLAPTDEAASRLGALRQAVAVSEAEKLRWEENWSKYAAPLLLRAARQGQQRGSRPMFATLAVTTILTLGSLLIWWRKSAPWLLFDLDEAQVIVRQLLAVLW